MCAMSSGQLSDPDVLAFVAKTSALMPSAEESLGLTLPEVRPYYDRMCAAFHVGYPSDIRAHDQFVSSSFVPGHRIPVRVYEPSKISRSGSRPALSTPSDVEKVAVTLVYVHGGGWVVGGLESHDDICAELASGLGARVVAVDYRLAPEHRCPAALDDVVDVAQWVSLTYGRMAMAGDSAGGHLTAGYCWRASVQSLPRPLAQGLIYPALFLPTDRDGSYVENAKAPGLSTADCIAYFSAYLGDDLQSYEEDAWRYGVAPGAAPDASVFPPTVMTAAGYDPLRDDVHLFAERLQEAGVTHAVRHDPELVHAHLRARHMVPAAGSHFAWFVETMRRAMADQL